MPLLHIGSSGWETTNTTGTGAITLNGARAGYDTLVTSVGVGNHTGYTIRSEIANEYEVGIGQVGAGNLTRVQVLHSSNGGMPINLTADTHEVVTTIPAETLQNLLETHRGATAPTWFADGMTWMDDSNYPIICERIYDASSGSWSVLGCTDASTGLPAAGNITNITNLTSPYVGDHALWNGFLTYWNGSQYVVPKGTVLQQMVAEETPILINNTNNFVTYQTLNITPLISGSTLIIDSKLKIKRSVVAFGGQLVHQLRANGVNIVSSHIGKVQFATFNASTSWGQDFGMMGEYNATTAGTIVPVEVVFKNGPSAGDLTAENSTIRVYEIAP